MIRRFHTDGERQRRGYEVSSLRGLVVAGFGVTLAPKRAVSAATYVDLPVSSPECFRVVGVSWRKERWLSPKALAFRDYLVKKLPTMNLSRDKGDTIAESTLPAPVQVGHGGARARSSR